MMSVASVSLFRVNAGFNHLCYLTVLAFVLSNTYQNTRLPSIKLRSAHADHELMMTLPAVLEAWM